MANLTHKINSSPVTWIAALSFTAALISGLLFNGIYGIQLDVFAVTLSLLILWLFLPPLTQYNVVLIPISTTGILITLFWLWCGITISWSQAPLVSTINFWWLGSLPIAYWGYLLSRDKESLWSICSRLILFIITLLAIIGLYQLFILHERPHSTFLNPNSHAALIMLAAIPLSGYLLQKLSDNKASLIYVLFISGLALLFYYSLAHSQSRGVALSFFISITFMLLLLRRDITGKHLGIIILLILAGYLLANISVPDGITGRLQTLSNPASAGSDRFIIWQQSWEMLKTSPLIGIGLGIFWLAYPRYRDPTDGSGGLYVHNDYLQIWIETGLPGLVLLVSVLVSITLMLVRGLRSGKLALPQKIETISLFCALAAIAMHSFFTFNFYILPILILLGLVLARFQHNISTVIPIRVFTLVPQQLFSQNIYRVILIMSLLFPVSYLTAVGLSEYFHQQGRELAKTGQLQAADQSLRRAQRLSPLADVILFARADLYRQGITLLPPSSIEERKALFLDSNQLLDKAVQHNRLRPQPHYLHGMLHHNNPALSGDGWAQRAEKAYVTALTLDPLFYNARYEYARLLLNTQHQPKALQLLLEGLAYPYPDSPKLGPYLGLTAMMLFESNQIAKAVDLARRVDRILEHNQQPTGFLDRMREHYQLDLSENGPENERTK